MGILKGEFELTEIVYCAYRECGKSLPEEVILERGIITKEFYCLGHKEPEDNLRLQEGNPMSGPVMLAKIKYIK